MRRRRRGRRSVIRGARLIIRSAGPLRLRAARAARVFACPPGAELLWNRAVLGPHSSELAVNNLLSAVIRTLDWRPGPPLTSGTPCMCFM